MLKANNRKRCEICSKVSMKTTKRRPQNGTTLAINFTAFAGKFTFVGPFCGRRSGVFVNKFE